MVDEIGSAKLHEANYEDTETDGDGGGLVDPGGRGAGRHRQFHA
jgi:hypothetical protein